MPKVRICNIGVSIDGFVAGPGQSAAHPLGVGGEAVHAWAFATRSFSRMSGGDGKGEGVDDQIFASGFEGVGAWIIGRNMFGPDHGPWGAQPWRGWWGDNPPFHCPVIVLTHHPREKLEMDGGTVFHFETGGTRAALTRALEAAGGKDVRIGGGASVLRQYLWGGFVDEMHLAVAPPVRRRRPLRPLPLPPRGPGRRRHALLLHARERRADAARDLGPDPTAGRESLRHFNSLSLLSSRKVAKRLVRDRGKRWRSGPIPPLHPARQGSGRDDDRREASQWSSDPRGERA